MPRPAFRLSSTGILLAILLCGPAAAATLDEARELHRAGRLDEAVAAYRAALAGAQLDEAARAIAGNNLCVVLDALGELAAAESACRAALELRRALEDPLRLARTLNNLGLVLQHQGRYGEAENRFAEALAINRELGLPDAQAINLANLGAVATLAGHFQRALERHRSVVELARGHPGERWAAEQLRIARLNRGVVLERLGAYRDALAEYAALEAEPPLLRPEQEAAILMNSGVVYRNLGDPVRAIERFEAAAAAYGEIGDRSGLAHAELNVGIARHLNLGDAAAAEAAYRRALELVRRAGDRALEIEALVFLGRLLVSEGRPSEAHGSFARALELARDSGSAEGEWAALAGLAEVERSQGEPEAALAHFEAAIARIEEGRSEVVRPDYRAAFSSDKRSVYSGALETLAELERRQPGRFAARALEVVQQAKARDLLDSLGERSPDADREAAPARPLAAPEILRRLGGELLLEYFVADGELLLWWNAGGAVRLATLGDPRPILAAVEGVHKALAEGDAPPERALAQLARQLLGPVGPLVGAADSLLVAPDRGLHYLPFELLPLPGASGAPLIEHARVAYLPSAWALLDAARAPGRPGEVGFLGFGGVDPARASSYPPWVPRLALEPLPSARRELESAARRVPGERLLFIGPAATEAAFRAQTERRAEVLHFATHATLTEGRNQGTAILLTPEGHDDGMLLPSEIVSSPVGARLVVLAACATSQGGAEDGRALTTLTGSFLATGSEAVLATLWPVADQPTAAFMEQLYYQLSRGLEPGEALRRTKLRFLRDERWRSPALWSGYVLIGSTAPITTRGLPWTWIGALALVLALVALALRARARGSF